jgi:hypothetical protein
MSLEERLGTQWAVWVGGLALALGGIFLVRYSIEQGLLGPGVRVTLGALLAAALVGAGEWARRSERLAGISGLPTAHIPGILTAAGTTVAYADVYAAHALYGFLAPGSAFVLLGLVALATLAAALLHGPALAGLGLVGAYVAPLLVASQRPDYWSLYGYLAVVTAAAFALARFRMWRWLAITAVAFSALWALPGMGVVGVDALGAHAFHVIVGFALAATLIVAGLWYGPSALPGHIDGVSSAALGAYLLAASLLVLTSRHDPLALATFALLAAATVAIAWRAEAAAAACRRRQCSSCWCSCAGPPISTSSTCLRRPVRLPEPYPNRRKRMSGGISYWEQASRCCSAAPAIWRRGARSGRSCLSCGAPRRCSRRSRFSPRSITASPDSSLRSRLRRPRYCSAHSMHSPPRRWINTRRVRDLPRQARSLQPARSPRSRSR